MIFTCSGECHSGDWADFDHFCDVIGVTEDETPVAFAIWIEGLTGESIKGRYGPVPQRTRH